MRVSPFLTAALLLLMSCSASLAGCHTAVRNSAPSEKDSVSTASVANVYPKSDKPNDTAAKASTSAAAAADDVSEEPSLDEIYQECIDRYAHPKVIDTVFKMGDDRFRLRLKHYCLMDSGVHVPKTYTKLFHLDSFVTHNFVTDITLDRGDQEILRRTIVKRDFNQLLFPALKSYAILFPPDLRLGRDSVILGYSISIPLTDVGVGLSAVIDGQGRILFEDRRAYN
jgi:hypothetical protein